MINIVWSAVVAQWLECQPANLEDVGSNPTCCLVFLIQLSFKVLLGVLNKSDTLQFHGDKKK